MPITNSNIIICWTEQLDLLALRARPSMHRLRYFPYLELYFSSYTWLHSQLNYYRGSSKYPKDIENIRCIIIFEKQNISLCEISERKVRNRLRKVSMVNRFPQCQSNSMDFKLSCSLTTFLFCLCGGRLDSSTRRYFSSAKYQGRNCLTASSASPGMQRKGDSITLDLLLCWTCGFIYIWFYRVK